MPCLHKISSTWLSLFIGLNCFSCPLPAEIIWSKPVNVSAPLSNAIGAKVAVSPDGKATLIWSKYDGSNYVVQSSSSKIGGTWDNPKQLTQPGTEGLFANLAKDSGGGAIAIWTSGKKLNTLIQAADSKNNIWLPPQNLSKQEHTPFTASNPHVLFDAKDNAVAIWQVNYGDTNLIQSSARTSGRAWSQPANVAGAHSFGLGCIDPQLSLDKDGNAIAIWTNTSTPSIQTAYKPFKGSWSAPVDISDIGLPVAQSQVVLDNLGNATAIWSGYDGQNYIIHTADKPANGVWSAPISLSSPHQDAQMPQLAADHFGNVTAVWQKSNGPNTLIEAAVKSVHGRWSPPSVLSNPLQDASEPKIKVAPNGDTAAIWKISNGANFLIQASTKTYGSYWNPPAVLSATGQDAVSPELAVDSRGNLVAVWQRSNGANTIIQSCFGIQSLR